MRVYLSVDMEGVAGIATLDQILRGGSGYPRAQLLMTEEASAAVRGAISGGASEVVVADSHGTGDNLLLDILDDRARVVSGMPRPATMTDGLTSDFDQAVFLGYHAAAGAAGLLAHSFSANFASLRLNGSPVSEADINALYAASLNVPVGVVTGDEDICGAAAKAFPQVLTVPVKSSRGYAAAESLSPAAARSAIEQTVADSVRTTGRLTCIEVPRDLRLAADFAVPLYADFAATVPGTERVSAVTVERDADSARDLVRLIMSWYYLSSVGARQMAALAHRR